MYKTPFINAMLNRKQSTTVDESTNKSLFNNENYITSQCVYCENLTNYGCKTFKNNIPTIILNNLHDHRIPYINDNGITFIKSEVYKKEKIRIVSMDNTFPPKIWEI